METHDLDKIAKAFGLELPEAYRTFMLSFPEELYDLENEAGESYADYEFLDDPERIIELNEAVREDPYYSEEDEKERDWPTNFLVIGENANEDYFCIDVDIDTPIVYLFDHNEGDFTECADDLEAYVDAIKEGAVVAEEEPDIPLVLSGDDEEEED